MDRDTGARRPLVTWVVGAIVLALIVVAVLVLTRDDDDGGTGVNTGGTTTTVATAASTTTTAATTTSGQAAGDLAVWPPAESKDRHTDPVAAARAFATTFLRFTDPVVGAFQQGDQRSGEVEVRPTTKGPVTTILLRQLSGNSTWSVLGATTDTIELTSPGAGATVSSPVRLSGRAHAFEGTVQVEIRAAGEATAIGEGFVTGGGDEMRPFNGSVEFDNPDTTAGAIVLFTESAEDGRVWQAAVIPVRF